MPTVILPTGLRISEFPAGTFDESLDSASTDLLVPTANGVEDYSLRGYYTFGQHQITNGLAAYDFYGFPQGCSDIVLDVEGISLGGAGNPLVQFIVGGTAVTSGYAGSGTSFGASTTATTFNATGADIRISSAGLAASGRVRITRLEGNRWHIVHKLTYGNTIVGGMLGASRITLAGEPNGIRLAASTGLFDAGTARIGWR